MSSSSDLVLQELTKKLVEDIPEFKPHSEYIFRDPILFGDYRNALEIGEPRIYEDMQDYEASKALFEQVSLKHLKFRPAETQI